MSLTQIPKQKISLSEKRKNDFEWGKNTIKAYIDRTEFNTSRKDKMYDWYDAYNGRNNDSLYKYVSDPYKSKNGTVRKFPAKIRNYNIIKPVIDLLLGERSNRPFNYTVTVTNEDVKNKYEEYRTQQNLSYLEQAFVNKMNEQGAETGIPSKELPEPTEFEQQIETSYRDKRAIMGQEAMDYLVQRLELEDKLQTAFFDWLITGEVYSCKGVMFNEVEYDIVAPTDIFYEASPSVKFIEDGDMAGQRKLMSVHEVVDTFYDVLEEDEIDSLENPEGNNSDNFFIPFMHRYGPNDRDESDEERLVEVYHINWKSFVKVGYVDKPDEFGIMQTYEVNESYKPAEGEKVEWFWVNETWEGYQIDGNIYKHIRPVKGQRNELNNKSKCKLQYNGLAYSNRNSENIGVVEMGMPYQILFNIYNFRLELSIAKNKDKIALMEMNMVPKRHGWDEEKFMYFADAMGWAFIDTSAVGKNNERLNFNQFQVLDMSLGQYISAQFDLLQSIKQEWEDLLGISRQRKGNVLASDGAGTTNMAVAQSNVMTAELFRKFRTFEQRDMQGILDLSKHAWKDGKKTSYTTSDYREKILDIEPGEIQEAELGLFMSNSTKEDEKLKTLKQFAFQFAQNGSKPSTVSDILDSENFAKIKEKIREVELAEQKYNERVQQAEGQQAQQLEALKQQAEDNKRAFEAQKQDKEIASKEKMHTEKMEVEWAKLEKQPDPVDDSVEYAKIAQKDRELDAKERIENKKIKATAQKAKA